MTERIRTSLDRAPSGWTDDEIRARGEAAVQRAWRDIGLVAVRVDDPRLTWPERETLRQMGKRLWGTR